MALQSFLFSILFPTLGWSHAPHPPPGTESVEAPRARGSWTAGRRCTADYGDATSLGVLRGIHHGFMVNDTGTNGFNIGPTVGMISLISWINNSLLCPNLLRICSEFKLFDRSWLNFITDARWSPVGRNVDQFLIIHSWLTSIPTEKPDQFLITNRY